MSGDLRRPVRVVVLDDYQGVALAHGDWQRLGDSVDVSVVRHHIADTDDLVARLAGADVVVAMRERTPLPAERLGRLRDLRLLITTGMANAAIDVHAAAAQGVTVCGTASLAAPPAELTWGLILALARNLCSEDRLVRAGGWQHTLGLDLEGRTLGVIGLGKLGTRVAAIGRAFGMRVVAWSRNLDPDEARAQDVEPLTKEALLRTSDVVTLHLKLSDRSRGTIGADDLAAMKPTAYLVNTSRGPLVDEAALVDALRHRRIAGAGLDVFDVEPLPVDHPLRTLPNVVLTPHIGYVTTGGYEVFHRDVVDDIAAWLAGDPVRVLAGPQVHR
jgi:phosphoglycerate dehydrogenase-like enzyme